MCNTKQMQTTKRRKKRIGFRCTYTMSTVNKHKHQIQIWPKTTILLSPTEHLLDNNTFFFRLLLLLLFKHNLNWKKKKRIDTLHLNSKVLFFFLKMLKCNQNEVTVYFWVHNDLNAKGLEMEKQRIASIHFYILQ